MVINNHDANHQILSIGSSLLLTGLRRVLTDREKYMGPWPIQNRLHKIPHLFALANRPKSPNSMNWILNGSNLRPSSPLEILVHYAVTRLANPMPEQSHATRRIRKLTKARI
jgi:hypothetical protein